MIGELLDKTGKFNQIGEPEDRAVTTCNELRIRIDGIRPCFRHRISEILVYLNEQPFAVAMVSLT